VLAALASARLSRFGLFFVRSGRTDIATWRKPQNMLVQTNRAGARLRFQFGCHPSTPLSPVSDVNWFRHGAFFIWLGRP